MSLFFFELYERERVLLLLSQGSLLSERVMSFGNQWKKVEEARSACLGILSTLRTACGNLDGICAVAPMHQQPYQHASTNTPLFNPLSSSLSIPNSSNNTRNDHANRHLSSVCAGHCSSIGTTLTYLGVSTPHFTNETNQHTTLGGDCVMLSLVAGQLNQDITSLLGSLHTQVQKLIEIVGNLSKFFSFEHFPKSKKEKRGLNDPRLGDDEDIEVELALQHQLEVEQKLFYARVMSCHYLDIVHWLRENLTARKNSSNLMSGFPPLPLPVIPPSTSTDFQLANSCVEQGNCYCDRSLGDFSGNRHSTSTKKQGKTKVFPEEEEPEQVGEDCWRAALIESTMEHFEVRFC